MIFQARRRPISSATPPIISAASNAVGPVPMPVRHSADSKLTEISSGIVNESARERRRAKLRISSQSSSSKLLHTFFVNSTILMK